MKRTKKFLVGLLACIAVGLCSFGAACGGGNDSSQFSSGGGQSSSASSSSGGTSSSETVEEYTVTYDANGGNFAGGTTIQTVQVEEGNKAEAPTAPQAADKEFTGWYKEVTCITLWDFDNDTVNETLTLYAGWKDVITEYDVTFVLNYADAGNVVQSTENGLITYVPLRAGYVFNGWWYSDGETDEGYILSRPYDMTQLVTAEGLVLYAEWVEEATLSAQLVAPSVAIHENTFSWNAVEGAQSYNVQVFLSGVNGEALEKKTVTGTTWSFSDSYEAGYYTVKIRANGDGVNTVNSSYASKSYAHKILGKTNISINIETSLLSWTVVNYATEYDLYVEGELIEEDLSETTYDMSDYEAGRYAVKVVAKKDGYNSSFTNATVDKKRLKTPEISVHVDTATQNYVVSWKSVFGANVYILTINDEEIRLTENSYTLDNATYFSDGKGVTVALKAFDEAADYLISNSTEERTLYKTYALTVEKSIEAAGSIAIDGCIYAPKNYTVYFDLNGGDGETAAQTVTRSVGLVYPDVPMREGYVFRGWYTEKACKNLFDFSADVTGDTTVYAGWHKITTEGYSNTVIDVAGDYTNDDYRYTFSTNGTSFENARYIYFTALITAKYRICYTPSTSNYTSISFYNATKGEKLQMTIDERITDDTRTWATFLADAGDVIYVKAYGSGVSLYFYILDATYPKAGGLTENRYVATTGSDLSTVYANENEEITITAETRMGYTFVGWYDGETLLTSEPSYTFAMPAENISYKAKWTVAEELQAFRYTFTDEGVVITGIKDKTLTEIVVPDYVVAINEGAFAGCCNVESITLPFVGDSIKTASDTTQYPAYPFGYIFGQNKYDGATAVTQYYYNSSSTTSRSKIIYYIPTSLKGVTVTGGNLRPYAFYNCTGLTNVTIGDGVTSIGTYAFDNCYGLTIYCEAASKPSGWSSSWNDSNCPVVWNCNNNEVAADGSIYVTLEGLRYALKDSVATIAEQPKNITTANIPEKVSYKGTEYPVTSIGDRAFSSCSSLTSVTIGDSVISIGDNTFSNCSNLTSVTIGDGVTSIGEYAFSNCYNLTNITIGDSVTSIGDSAFSGCGSLTSITIPNSVTSIGDRAFYNCYGLTSVTIPDSVTSIGDYAFYDCSKVTSVTIGDGVEEIGYEAFSSCDRLTSVTIGNGVTSIGESAFSWCDILTCITFNGTVEEWNAISKGSSWINRAPATKVVCSDGEVAL